MKRRHSSKKRDRTGRLPRNAAPVELDITHVGGRGDGVGSTSWRHNHVTADHTVFVPASLPGERVIARPVSVSGQGLKTVLTEILTASPQRREPDCTVFPACGGCTLQHWHDDAVTAWKQDLVAGFLARAGVRFDGFEPPHISPRGSRRRAGFHLKRLADGVAAGFLERGSHRIIAPQDCSVLRPDLVVLLGRLADLAARCFPLGVAIDAQANGLDNGICLLLRGPASWHDGLREQLASWAVDAGIARLSVSDGTTEPLTLLAPAPPVLWLGEFAVTPPPGAFLQATQDAEAALQAAVASIIGEAARVLDLFSGCGTLGLPPLPSLSQLTAAESDTAALAALRQAVDAAGRGAQLTCIEADLMEAPLMGSDLAPFDAVIIDPPRAGAAAQCASLATSRVPVIAMVSCNPATFARDAATLIAGGYIMGRPRVIDQFRFSSHVEIIAGFSRDDSMVSA